MQLSLLGNVCFFAKKLDTEKKYALLIENRPEKGLQGDPVLLNINFMSKYQHYICNLLLDLVIFSCFLLILREFTVGKNEQNLN